MRPALQPAKFSPANEIAALQPDFADPVAAADFPQAILRFRNDRWADAVGLGELGEEE